MKKMLAMFMATSALGITLGISSASAQDSSQTVRSENIEEEADFQPMLNQCYSRYWRQGEDCWTTRNHCPEGYFGTRRGCPNVSESDEFDTQDWRRRRSRSCGMTCEYLYRGGANNL